MMHNCPVVVSFLEALRLKDQHLFEHSIYVGTLARDVGISMGFPQWRLDKLQMAGLLHDIGKIAIRNDILNKTTSLTDEEWEQIQMHPILGVQALQPFIEMEEVAKIVLSHHENDNGSGYPRGLKGDDIPFDAKIVRTCDVFSATVNERPYKCAYPKQEAIRLSLTGSGLNNNDIGKIREVLLRWNRSTINQYAEETVNNL